MMTQDEIICMAYEAGAVKGEHTVLNHTWFEFGPKQLERFTALVAAHERERMWCDAEFARQQEREACAKVCETDELCCKCGDECAEAIRAMGDK